MTSVCDMETIEILFTDGEGQKMIFIVATLVLFWGDFFLKKYVETHMGPKESREICRGRILLRKYHNYGAALNFLERRPKLVRNFCGILLLAAGTAWLLMLRRKDNPAVLLGLSLLIGGGASNFYDRCVRGYVVDYFSFQTPWKRLNGIVFNISDFFVFIGAVLASFAGKK